MFLWQACPAKRLLWAQCAHAACVTTRALRFVCAVHTLKSSVAGAGKILVRVANKVALQEAAQLGRASFPVEDLAPGKVGRDAMPCALPVVLQSALTYAEWRCVPDV